MTVRLSDTPVLETERLRLRAPHAADWPIWREMAASDRAKFITTPDYTEALAWRGMGHIIGHWVLRGWGSFIITWKDSDTALGMTGPWFPASWPEKEIGWALWDGAHEGKGIATEAASAARDYAFTTLGWTTAVSYINPKNTGSIAVAQRLGATLDASAVQPFDEEVLVYRHTPRGAAA